MTTKTNLSKEQIEEFRESIQGRLEEARRIVFEQEKVIEEAREGDRRGYGDSEEAWETQTTNEAKAIIAKQQPYINALENALVRIKAGTYGICLVTGEPIPIERLRLVSHATMCVQAKKTAA